jgi:putative toxin-antitoxin system antitoxin component (TIGR02293 family)
MKLMDREATLARPINRKNEYKPAAQLLGLKNHTVSALVEIEKRGLPYQAVDNFRRTMGYSTRYMANLMWIKPRTMTRRRIDKCLEPAETVRLLGIANVIGKALDLWHGNAAMTRAWLSSPHPWLSNKTPMELIQGGGIGAREVERLINLIKDGSAY